MNKSPILAKRDLVGEATDWMREQIFSGVFPEGESLPAEGSLAVRLGLSRNAMREAMRNLRTQGLVEVSQGKRPKVKRLNADAAICTIDALLRRSGATPIDLMAVRIPLEAEIVAIATLKANSEDISLLEQTIEKLESATSVNQRIDADIAFHKYLAQITGNPVFSLMLETISGLLREAQLITFPKAGIATAMRGHLSIIEAIKAGCPDNARKAMVEHLEASKRELAQDV
ncbi:MAG: FadR family transcriptional regulator [Kiritimatiellae bacterium]|nr:FadR family transcriptional regulator [Kiritimatiellia bacterium]